MDLADRPAPLIELVGVTKTYGSGPAALQALAGVDLRVSDGEFVAIMGPSGCVLSHGISRLSSRS